MIKLTNPFTSQALERGLQALDVRYPRVMLGLAIFVSGVGVLLLLLAPLLLLIGLFKVPAGISAADNLGAWLGVLTWLLITALSAVVSYTLLRVKPALPSGLGLKEDKAPLVYELLAELGTTYQAPTIHRITVHEHEELALIPVPRFGLPLFPINVLYLGLPHMQYLSPAQFRGALARRLGQYSGAHNKLTHWVYRWRQYCEQYQRLYNKQPGPLYLPLRLFYRFYTPLLHLLSASIARRDELQADIYTLELMNDTELADLIVREEVCREFLRSKYWPKIHSMLHKQTSEQHLPHQSMTKVLRKALTDNEIAQTLKILMDRDPDWQAAVPDLHTRLENIGQSRLEVPPPVMETAAQRYLGEAFSAVVKLLDKQWLARHGKPSKKSPAPQRRSNKPEVTRTEATRTAQSPRIQSDAPKQPPRSAASQPQPSSNQCLEEVLLTAAPDIRPDESPTVTVAERKRLTELKQKSQAGKLSDQEAWELASLTEKLEDKTLAISLYQQVLRQNPNHAKTLFAVGRILLAKQDPTGVKALERAMELDKGCIAQACWMLAKHFKASGDETTSRKYLERAANVSAAA